MSVFHWSFCTPENDNRSTMMVAAQNSPAVERPEQSSSKDKALRLGKDLDSGDRGGNRSVGLPNFASMNGSGADGVKAASGDRTASVESAAVAEKNPPTTKKAEERGSGRSPVDRFRVPVLSRRPTALVLRNELQRLLVVMRTQRQRPRRYVSPSRFTAEFVDSIHPLAQRVEEMHQSLGHDDDEDADDASASDVPGFVDVLCALVEESDGALAVTAAALEALQKIFACGVVKEEDEELVAQVAKCLVLGNFDDPNDEGARCSHPATTPAPSSNAPPVTLARRASSSIVQNEPVPKDVYELLRFRLLGMSSLVTRMLLPSRTRSNEAILLITALMDNCWNVVSKKGLASSPLLYAKAVEALSEVTACVFGASTFGQEKSSTTFAAVRLVLLERISGHLGSTSTDGGASSSDARDSSRQQTQSSLLLLNLALEVSSGRLTPAEMEVIQEETCKQLLLVSLKRDVDILTGTLRVISNLLPLRAHLKVQLEVLLVNLHLRVLAKGSGSSHEEIEVVLESIQSCCQDSRLLTDIYFNYDCDVVCTDLFESIVSSVGRAALPDDWSATGDETSAKSPLAPTVPQEQHVQTPSSAGAITGRSAKQTNNNPARPSLKSHLEASHTKATGDPVGGGDTTAKTSTAPFNHLNRLAIESLFSVLDSILRRNGAAPIATERAVSNSLQNEERLLQAKQKKDALRKIAIAFNTDPASSAWTDIAVAEGQLDSQSSAGGVADILFNAPGLNKAQVGEYLSKGPASDYPFHAQVRNHFASLFDFSGLTFAAALRLFLSKFRLPGEAQCIDRLMEAFSGQLYKQQLGKTFFKNSDAVYVLAFSTIMLNTDLHNPTIKKESRMTLRQFIRNNRGINGGQDMPEDFLSELYEQIKHKQIQVKREMADVITRLDNESDVRTTWEYVMEKNEVVSYDTVTVNHCSTAQTMLHDKIMFSALAKWLVQALPSAFLRSWDDALVVRALNGMKNAARLAAHFELNWVIDDILSSLLPMGRDYISGCVALDYSTVNDCGSVVSSVSRTVASTEAGAEDDETTTCESELPIPYGLLSTRDERVHRTEIFGSASHRGILALDCSFVLFQQHTTRVSKSWSGFVECLCGLRDARALPAGLADLDDFADSDGSVLPMSRFARISQRRLDEYYRAKSDPDASKQKGWFRSFFKKQSTGKESDSFDEDEYLSLDRGELSSYSKALLGIAEASGIDAIVVTSATDPATAELSIRAFLNVVGRYPYDDDPVQEQRAVFALELATRALLSNKQQAPESFALFLSQFERILGQVRETLMPAPFVLERLVVTVLRACIHLYEHQEVR
jgi:golgi-specific brefeldin A-resistance guanine nucleotide exchange factor 1